MKTFLLASVLATTPALVAEQSTPQELARKTSAQVQEVLPEGIQATIILSSLFLGSALGALADAQYRKRVPPDKRIEARVLKMLGETKRS